VGDVSGSSTLNAVGMGAFLTSKQDNQIGENKLSEKKGNYKLWKTVRINNSENEEKFQLNSEVNGLRRTLWVGEKNLEEPAPIGRGGGTPSQPSV